jgi:hypothetical protein
MFVLTSIFHSPSICVVLMIQRTNKQTEEKKKEAQYEFLKAMGGVRPHSEGKTSPEHSQVKCLRLWDKFSILRPGGERSTVSASETMEQVYALPEDGLMT